VWRGLSRLFSLDWRIVRHCNWHGRSNFHSETPPLVADTLQFLIEQQ
jgi:hypothetical protein